MDCRVALLLAVTRKWRPRNDEGVAVSERLSSVSDTIFNLDIIHRTDMQGNISARQQAEDKLQLYASVFRHAREGITITDRPPEQGVLRRHVA